MFDRYVRYTRFSLERIRDRLRNLKKTKGIWIDVGAHLGERTFEAARRNPSLLVYAFEPNLSVALQRVGLLRNFIIIPIAVAEQDGSADFYINSYDASSSLLPLNPGGVEKWKGGEQLKVERKVTVPTIRLDTFMNLARIKSVDYLKIDAQGSDFSVIKSLGERLQDIKKITLEVSVTPFQLYEGSSNRDEIVSYLSAAGFTLTDIEKQSYDQEENLSFVQLQ